MRLFIMTLSILAIGGFGYALAGFGGFVWGKGRVDYIAWGLIGGAFAAALAIYLFKKNPQAFFMDSEDEEEQQKSLKK